MSEKGNIDSALYRPVDGGNFYDKYIPSSTCKSSFLGAGDTYFSMEGIKANILKNHSQCARLAPQLQKKSLAQTVTAIYDFLYNHIQYKADGSDQNLRSPACSWHVRKSGIDCKSYSIFAGCILACLGIKFYIRKIKQPYMLPNEFTHVFIVVPKDQKTGSLKSGYYVIDATKHENTEAAFSEKNDVFMDKLKHFGLQAPATRRTRKRGLNGADTATPMAAFSKFTAMLKEAGVKPDIVNKMNSHIREEVKNGNDPEIKISKKAIIVDRTLYPFLDKNEAYANVPDFIVATRSSWGLNASGDPGTGTGTGSGDGSGIDYEKIMDQAGEELEKESEGWLEDIFSKIMDFFKCIGSSATPKKTREWRANVINPFFTKKIEWLAQLPVDGRNLKNPGVPDIIWNVYIKNINDGVTNWYKQAAIIKAHQLFHKGESNAKCGADANQAMADYMQAIIELMDRAVERMKSDYTMTVQNVNIDANKHSIPEIADNWKGKTVKATYKQYTFKLRPGAAGGINIDPLPGGGGNTGNGNTGGGNTGNGNTGGGNTGGGNNTGHGGSTTGGGKLPYVQVKNVVGQPQQMGMNKMLMFGLIAGSIYMAWKKNQKTAKN